jgi:AraC-like DNA-binding protein
VGRELAIRAWTYGEDVVLESYRYASGPAGVGEMHSHEEYQFCLSLNFPGEYRYRGERHPVPVGSLSVIHPGEVHSSRDPHDRKAAANFRVMYLSPGMLANAASEVAGRYFGLPFFRQPILLDRDITTGFLKLHQALEGDAPGLEEDSRLLDVLARLIQRRAEGRPSPGKTGRERRAVRLAREYLEDNHAKRVSLEELASAVHLSPFHLARVFKEEVGLPPHAYQTQARLRRAKDLLLRGWPISRVAHATGFFDQSHFARHFKRLVGVPPGSYAAGDSSENSKNVHYGGA